MSANFDRGARRRVLRDSIRRPSPAMIVAIIALAFSMIGTAAATKVFVNTDAHSANKKVKRGWAGPKGAQGPQGSQGAPGAQGSPGVNGAAGDALPAGAVSFFNLAACPSGWTELTAARGRYLVGVPSGGTLASTVGTALSNVENRPVGQHTHGLTDPGHVHTMGIQASGTGAQSGLGAGNGVFVGTIYDTASATTGITINNAGSVAGTNAPYLQLMVCQKS